ncbi:hypothetical protein SO694_00180043 [Aureococcus anophagefferens]|uniref:Flavodoxin-like domain-containing protein n=1 Tax=Aureococcus anophagefferens TaxID=44056 RepID=A0ABR1FGE6_AURAN
MAFVALLHGACAAMNSSGPLTQERAWAAAPALCNGTADRPAPMLVFVHIFKSAGSTTTRATLKACTAAVRARVGAAPAANATLAWEYAAYGAAVGIHDARCRARLGADVARGRAPAFPFLAA